MILRQIAVFFATYLLSEKVSRAQTNWITDSTKALTYSAITTIFITKLGELLKKSVIVIPLSIFGTVLAILCYIDLMNALDYGSMQIQPSFWINLVVGAICFFGAVYAFKYSSKKDDQEGLTDSSATNLIADPMHSVSEQIQENFSFFKRGFEQAFVKQNYQTYETTEKSYD